MSEHHWSGWPGAICLKCGATDPIEEALADGRELDEQLWLGDGGTDPVQCPVEGKLVWRDDRWCLEPE